MPLNTSPLHRRIAIALLAVAALPSAWGQAAWPSKPVRFIVAFPPGGLADVMMRVLQPQLTEALGQPVVIDNRSGAAGNLAAAEMVKSGPDGHSFLVTVSTTESVNPVLFKHLPFDPAKDLVPVALLANSQLFLLVRPTLPVNSLAELVAWGKAHPGQLSYGSAGSGTTPHLAGEMFKQNAGIFATHIPYRGAAPAIQDVMAGQIDFTFGPGTVFSSVRAGKLKLLGVASRQRTPNYPDAPTFNEKGLGSVYADTLFGVYAPAGTPAPVVERLNREINRVLAQPGVKARFADMGADAVPISPAAFKALVQDETKLFGAIVKTRGISLD